MASFMAAAAAMGGGGGLGGGNQGGGSLSPIEQNKLIKKIKDEMKPMIN
jgi:hypothetical protein